MMKIHIKVNGDRKSLSDVAILVGRMGFQIKQTNNKQNTTSFANAWKHASESAKNLVEFQFRWGRIQ